MEQLLRNPQFDEFGLLLDPEDWSPELARELASGDGIDELSEKHWAFIHALRDYYEKFHVPPPPSQICHKLGLAHSCGHELFPTCLAAWRIAGLPDPGEEAKSYLSAG